VHKETNYTCFFCAAFEPGDQSSECRPDAAIVGCDDLWATPHSRGISLSRPLVAE
jgi:hypothetical protein